MDISKRESHYFYKYKILKEIGMTDLRIMFFMYENSWGAYADQILEDMDIAPTYMKNFVRRNMTQKKIMKGTVEGGSRRKYYWIQDKDVRLFIKAQYDLIEKLKEKKK